MQLIKLFIDQAWVVQKMDNASYEKLYHWIMQFESFYWHSHHGL